MMLNGVKLGPKEYLKDATKNTLNQMLGSDGLPKYTQDQLKDITRQQLLDEVTPLFEASNTPTKPKGTNGKRGAKPKPSKNENSARAKKCTTIAALANGTKTLEEIKPMYDNDYFLQKVCQWSELVRASETKQRPQTKRKSVNVTIDNGDYIVAYGLGEGPKQ